MAGNVQKRPNGKWRARYRDHSGREHARHFDRKADAQRWVDEQTSDLLRGTWVDPRAGRISFRDYAEQWRAVQVHRPTTAASVARMLRKHVYPALGERPIAEVRQSEIQALVKTLSQDLAPSTTALVYKWTRAVFHAAVTDRVIVPSPCSAVRLPKIAPNKVEPLGVEHVWDLADAMPDRYRALVIAAAGTGLRPSECFGLTVDRIDFLRRRLTVDRQLQDLPGHEIGFSPPKTQASYRVVPLPNVVLDVLAEHLARYPASGGELIFTGEHGGPVQRRLFGDLWRSAGADLPTGTRFHDLRHHYASLLIRHGESVKVVQARLDHASASETLDTYAHLWPDSEDQTREAVDLALGQPARSRGLFADRHTAEAT